MLVYSAVDTEIINSFIISVRTALLAIIGFMPTHGGGALGSLNYTPDERKALAKRYSLLNHTCILDL